MVFETSVVFLTMLSYNQRVGVKGVPAVIKASKARILTFLEFKPMSYRNVFEQITPISQKITVRTSYLTGNSQPGGQLG